MKIGPGLLKEATTCNSQLVQQKHKNAGKRRRRGGTVCTPSGIISGGKSKVYGRKSVAFHQNAKVADMGKIFQKSASI